MHNRENDKSARRDLVLDLFVDADRGASSDSVRDPIERSEARIRIEKGQTIPDVSVIIVNYNVREFLVQSLSSVYAAMSRLSVEVFVVDNNSVDDSVTAVRTRFPEVNLICNKENIGFGSANNVAIRQARGRYLFILNPDTIIQEDTLDVLKDFMEDHPEAGAAGCRILNPDGSFARESRRAFPTSDVALYKMVGLSRLFPKSKRFGRYNLTYLPIDQMSEVDALSGSCMMVRAAALVSDRDGSDEGAAQNESKIGPGTESGTESGAGSGLFDESFFMYGEDLDLCYRIQKAGWKIYYVPDTQIIHYKGESTKKGELRYVRHFYGAMLLFIEKHLDPGRSRMLSGMLRTGILLRAGLSYMGHHLRRARPVLLDFAIIYATVTLLGMARSAAIDRTLSPLFYASVSPAYAFSTVLGIYLTRGYRRPAEFHVRCALAGILLGGLVAAATGFFLPGIAFSRIVVAATLPVGATLLVAWRLRWKSRYGGPRDAILVGDEAEAERLKRMIDAHPTPPFLLAGYVGNRVSQKVAGAGSPVRLGDPGHLRDLARLRKIREIVFAARCLSNQEIFDTMRHLRDLDVQFRMFHAGSEHVIGKSQVSPISLGSLLAQLPEVVELRQRSVRRRFEIPAALFGIVLLPFMMIASRLTRSEQIESLADRLRLFPQVLFGSLYLVGVRPEHVSLIPNTWELKEGVFSITNTINTQALNPDELSRAYWYYVTHQSAGFDTDIILRSIRIGGAADI